MDRKEFLSQLGITGAAVFMGACMSGCSKDSASPAPSNVDFTINLSDPANAALGSAGGFIYKNNVIIARTQSNTYIAVSQACTHEGSTVQFQGPQNRFYCPNHGATFSTAGAVTNGPATKALVSYNTQVSGTTLRIYS
jgi:cytochrome b6-f complex iron-sulfur subunit